MKDKTEIKLKETQLLELVGTFCAQELDDDYYNLCEKLIRKMGRKREVPFTRGNLEIWAAATVHAIGSINFLFDRSFQPHVTGQEICDHFGAKSSTVSGKAAKIKDMFKLSVFDKEFSTQQVNQDNPFVDLVMVDGFIVPMSSIPENLQEIVRTERAAGRDVEFASQPT